MTAPPRFFGSHGDDWCCRQAMYGPPDRLGKFVAHWLIHPGPPIGCYFVHFFPMPATDRLDYYHAHPKTWSLHFVVEGTGFYYAEGKRHEIAPGSVMYHGPGIPHCGPFPHPETEMKILVIQHPTSGHHKGEWIVVPEAGLAERPGDAAAFFAKYGKLDVTSYIDSYPDLPAVPHQASERWAHYCSSELAEAAARGDRKK